MACHEHTGVFAYGIDQRDQSIHVPAVPLMPSSEMCTVIIGVLAHIGVSAHIGVLAKGAKKNAFHMI